MNILGVEAIPISLLFAGRDALTVGGRSVKPLNHQAGSTPAAPKFTSSSSTAERQESAPFAEMGLSWKMAVRLGQGNALSVAAWKDTQGEERFQAPSDARLDSPHGLDQKTPHSRNQARPTLSNRQTRKVQASGDVQVIAICREIPGYVPRERITANVEGSGLAPGIAGKSRREHGR